MDNLEPLDLADFSLRWRRARLSALRAFLSGGRSDGPDHAPDQASLTREAQLLSWIDPDAREAVLRFVFERSRQLGLSMARFFFQRRWDGEAVSRLLANAGIPCLEGSWSTEQGARALSRPACRRPCGAFGCAWWREAADGLVTGLSDEVRYTRHRSAAAGDAHCFDLVYPARSIALRWGALTAELREGLAPLQASLAKDRIVLRLEGLSEGTLAYRLETDGSSPCGPGRELLCRLVEQECRTRFPGMKVMEISERSVL